MIELEQEHSLMVAALAKPGAMIKAELTPEQTHALHMAVGISGEAGELLDTIKKWTIYQKPLDAKMRANLIEELGDLEFYIEGLRQGLDIERPRTLSGNIDKLRVRYAAGYSDKAAQERADKPNGE